MLCFPPESFFGQVVRLEAMAELMRRQQVVVRCVSEFAMGLRELALVGQGAAWLPGSLIADDVKRGRLMPLESLGRSVAMDIVAFFAVRPGEKGELLKRQFQALRDQAEGLSPAAENTKNAAAARGRRVTKTALAR
jgi:LysR family transcriptional regulator, hypochlorite-specific transcription factor HypT